MTSSALLLNPFRPLRRRHVSSTEAGTTHLCRACSANAQRPKLQAVARSLRCCQPLSTIAARCCVFGRRRARYRAMAAIIGTATPILLVTLRYARSFIRSLSSYMSTTDLKAPEKRVFALYWTARDRDSACKAGPYADFTREAVEIRGYVLPTFHYLRWIGGACPRIAARLLSPEK